MNVSFNLDRFYWTLAHDAPDAVIYADANGLIRFWNSAAVRVFGFSESQALGQSLDIIIPANLRARHWTGYAEALRTGRTRYGAGELLAVPALRKDGARISVEFTILPIRGDNGDVLGMAAILRDVTTRFTERLFRLSCGLVRDRGCRAERRWRAQSDPRFDTLALGT